MRKYLILILASCSATLLLNSCLVLFPKYKQKIAVKSATPDAVIRHGKDSVGITNATFTADKNLKFDNLIVEKPGFKSKNYCFERRKLSPLYALSIFDMVILGPFWEFNYPTCQNYASEHIVPALAPMENRGVNEKYMLVNNVAADIKGKDIGFYLYKSIKKLNLGKPKYSLDSTKVRKREDLVVENTVYSDELNEVLKKMNFIDTTRTIFPDQRNTVYLNATIKKVAFRLVQREKETDRHIMYTDLTIEWDLLDYYKQKVYSTVTNTTSDGMIYLEKEETNKKGSESIFNKLVHDNMEYAIIDLKGKLKEKGLLKMSGNSEDSMMTLTLNTPASMAGKRLNDFLKSSVSVKVDDGHGSGVIISVDGYIVTNYHVVAGSKKVEVIFNDGSKLEATVVRKSPEVDLALLKVSRDSLLPLQLSSNDIPDIGGEVWAIGTPRSLELGQSVSKGIVSATRKSNDLTYIQTDVKISPGNSGGALVNRDGVVQGIVSAKLISTGTEGVGFAIPSAVVLKKLKIQYK